MLKFLTYKLKTHSLNEDKPLDEHKVDETRDSGTESDDEILESEDQEINMDNEVDRWSGNGVTPSPDSASASASSPDVDSVPTVTSSSPYFIDSALPSDSDLNYDQHSSEEELEVINSSCGQPPGPRQMPDRERPDREGPDREGPDRERPDRESRATSCTNQSATIVPEKRKWSQVSGGCGGGRAESGGGEGREGHVTECRLVDSPVTVVGSSDEEVQGLLATMATPVKFRTSPPRDAHKPGQRSFSPPIKLFHLDVSPRKRHRHTPRPHHIQRPCLDFEKMQQLKARAVTAWRHGGEHGGELSVFCW